MRCLKLCVGPTGLDPLASERASAVRLERGLLPGRIGGCCQAGEGAAVRPERELCSCGRV